MTGIVRAGSRDRARSTQIGIACELRRKPGAAVPELTMDGGPRIRAGLGADAGPRCAVVSGNGRYRYTRPCQVDSKLGDKRDRRFRRNPPVGRRRETSVEKLRQQAGRGAARI